MKNIIKTFSYTVVISMLLVSSAHAELKLQAKTLTPKPIGAIAAQAVAKPAICASGFVAVGKNWCSTKEKNGTSILVLMKKL